MCCWPITNFAFFHFYGTLRFQTGLWLIRPEGSITEAYEHTVKTYEFPKKKRDVTKWKAKGTRGGVNLLSKLWFCQLIVNHSLCN